MTHVRAACCAWGWLLSVSPALLVSNTGSERIRGNKNSTKGARNHGEWRTQIFLKFKSGIENMYIWRLTLMEESSPRKDFALVALLRPIHMPGKRIGEISVHLLTQWSPIRSLHAEPFFAQLLLPHQSQPIWWPQFGRLS